MIKMNERDYHRVSDFSRENKKYRIHPELLLEMSQHDGVGISIFPANHRAKYIFGKSLKHHFQMVENSYHFYGFCVYCINVK